MTEYPALVDGRPTLVTTALEETWPSDGEVVFLGEWCRDWARRTTWTELDASLVPYHWDDRAKLADDAEYLDDLGERLLARLGTALGEVHEVDHGDRYWRILLGPWVADFVGTRFDRWECVRAAVELVGPCRSYVLDLEDPPAPRDYAESVDRATDRLDVHRTFCRILASFPQVEVVPVEARWKVEVETTCEPSARPPVVERAIDLLERFSVRFGRPGDALVIGSFMRWRDEFATTVGTSRSLRIHRSVPRPLPVAMDPALRSRLGVDRLGQETDRSFERFLASEVRQCLPTSYLEGYPELVAEADGQGWPDRPPVVFTSRVARDDVLKAYIAAKSEDGAAVVVGQHGGNYGTSRWHGGEDHEVRVGDAFLSWGWTDEDRPAIRPVGYFRPLWERPRDGGVRDQVVMVTLTSRQLPLRALPEVLGSQWLSSFADQCDFVERLEANVRDRLIVRLHPSDHGWQQVDRWSRRLPGVRLDGGSGDIGTLLDRARVVVSTYDGTNNLESLASGFPTVMFWRREHWEMRSDAEEAYDHLRRVGVAHASPESAAAHLNEVWDDVDGWWSDPEVAGAVGAFVDRYCRTAGSTRSAVVAELRRVGGGLR